MKITHICGVVVVLFYTCNANNLRPIIGVLAQASHDGKDKGDTFISSSYFNFIGQAGARGVPIRVNESDAYYEKMFKSINGLLLPGGGVSVLTSGYAAAARKMFQMAIEAYDNGDAFPIWGTCLGFEQLAVLAAEKDVLSKVDGWNLTLPLNFVSDYKESKLYGLLSEYIYDYITTTDTTQNMHEYGLLTKTYESNTKLNEFFKVLTTNTDKNGLQYVSSMEAKKYPFFAVQFHPEKNIYDWDISVAVDHDVRAVAFTQYLSDVFVLHARNSEHHFASLREESDALIYNYQATFKGEPSFSTIYYFNYTHSETSGGDMPKYDVYRPDMRVVWFNYEHQLNLMLLLLGAILIVIVLLRITRLATLRSRVHRYHVVAQADGSSGCDSHELDPNTVTNKM